MDGAKTPKQMRGAREGLIYQKLKRSGLRLLAVALAALTLTGHALAAELPEELVPVGQAVGISIRTDGVMVSELSEFETAGGEKVSPAKEAGILPGDVIHAIGGQPVTSAEDMAEALSDAPETVTVELSREGGSRTVTVEPFFDGQDTYLGVWVRDGLTGIGTVTYYDPDTGEFGALGHSVADSATGALVPLREGTIMPATVTGVTKSRSGSPGKLGGTFDYARVIGTIDLNCAVGIFGTAGEELTGDPIPTAPAEDVKTGPVTVISDVSGEKREYSAEITRIYHNAHDSRDMMLKITDPELIELTGGIVQGMSGSPILQNGKLIGAVTHVLINDPEKGYGVFLENMVRGR